MADFAWRFFNFVTKGRVHMHSEALKKTELYFKKIFLRLDLYLSNFVGVKSNFGLVANINLAGSPLNLMTN